ncbi:hypothetical protein F511_07164 [Dorcoceras hygrometricum]|nr:hypothetical protein F511_07164 [Dorcoceras hygrometricum]
MEHQSQNPSEGEVFHHEAHEDLSDFFSQTTISHNMVQRIMGENPSIHRSVACWRLGAWLRPISRGNRHFNGRRSWFSESGPRLKTRLLRQSALENVTNLSRMESPHRGGRNKSNHDGNGQRRAAAVREKGGRGTASALGRLAPTSFTRKPALQTVGGGRSSIRSTTGIKTPSSACTRRTDEFRTDITPRQADRNKSDQHASLKLGRPYPYFDGPID